jgi:hypothetical protein
MGDWNNHDDQDPASNPADAARTVVDALEPANRPGAYHHGRRSPHAGVVHLGAVSGRIPSPARKPTRTTPRSTHPGSDCAAKGGSV